MFTLSQPPTLAAADIAALVCSLHSGGQLWPIEVQVDPVSEEIGHHVKFGTQ